MFCIPFLALLEKIDGVYSCNDLVKGQIESVSPQSNPSTFKRIWQLFK
jgi:hypothetical protein